MNNELTNEQKANYTKLKLFFMTKEKIHITLNRITSENKRYFYNGTIISLYDDYIFKLKDLKNKEYYVFSILEIKEGGISKYASK